LTGLLLPALLAQPGARVVTVTSMAHAKGRIRFDDMQAEHGYDPWAAYAQSKLANLLFALELDWRTRGRQLPLLSVAARPGLSATNLQSTGPGLGHTRLPTRAKLSFFRIIGQPAARAALPILYAATAPDIADGGFYGPCEPGGIRGTPSRSARHHLHATSPPADSCGKCPGSSPTWRIPPSSHRLLDHAPPQPDEKTGRVPTEGEPGMPAADELHG
jgi:hypothetical protein